MYKVFKDLQTVKIININKTKKHEPTNSRPMLEIEDVAEFWSSTLIVPYMYSSHVLRPMGILYISEGCCDFKVHTWSAVCVCPLHYWKRHPSLEFDAKIQLLLGIHEKMKEIFFFLSKIFVIIEIICIFATS